MSWLFVSIPVRRGRFPRLWPIIKFCLTVFFAIVLLQMAFH